MEAAYQKKAFTTLIAAALFPNLGGKADGYQQAV